MSSFASFFSWGTRGGRRHAHTGIHKAPPSNPSATGSGSPGKVVRKVLCRYGMGCTHVSDPVHRERFWHPPVPDAADKVVEESSNAAVYPCHECGRLYKDLSELQLHLKRKTAWSNKSLVGCRISCLVDNREWQEGLVLEFSSITGKHRVSLEHMGEIRWMQMLRTAFFIVQRQLPTYITPRSEQQGGETKEVEIADPKGLDPSLAPIEPWTYAEEISVEYARAQALMHRAYGSKIQETGHKTQGHLCVTENDKVAAKDAKSSLLYGELLPRGINKAMMMPRLAGERASVVYELGMGIGKVAMQVFLQFPNLTRVYGVELSEARFMMAEQAVLRLCERSPEDYAVTASDKGHRIEVTNLKTKGVLEMEVGNLLSVKGLDSADIVLLETDLSHTIYGDLCRLLATMKRGARAFTYLDLRKIWAAGCFPFRQLDINRPISDRYATSWSVNRGHHFFLWTKVLDSDCELPGSLEGLDPCMLPDELPCQSATTNSGEALDLFETPENLVYSSRDDPRRRAPPTTSHHHHYHSHQHHHGRRGHRGYYQQHVAATSHLQQGAGEMPSPGSKTTSSLPGWMRAIRRMWRGEQGGSTSSLNHVAPANEATVSTGTQCTGSSSSSPSATTIVGTDAAACQPKAPPPDLESPSRSSSSSLPTQQQQKDEEETERQQPHVSAEPPSSSSSSVLLAAPSVAESSPSSSATSSPAAVGDTYRMGGTTSSSSGEEEEAEQRR